jgi:hypothetical protein
VVPSISGVRVLGLVKGGGILMELVRCLFDHTEEPTMSNRDLHQTHILVTAYRDAEFMIPQDLSGTRTNSLNSWVYIEVEASSAGERPGLLVCIEGFGQLSCLVCFIH